MKAWSSTLLILALLGCSTTRHERLNLEHLSTALKPGDLVEVTSAKSQKQYIFRVTKVNHEAFWGMAKDKKEYKVSYSGLEAARRRTTDNSVLSPELIVWFLTSGPEPLVPLPAPFPVQ